MRITCWLFNKCARVTSGGALIPELDGMRFFAIVGVILFHCNNGLPIPCKPLALILSHGWFGVELFFVISGFILALPFARHYLAGEKKPAIGKYFLRRVTRLEPPYILSLVLYFVLLVWIFQKFTASDMLPHAVASLFYSHALANNIACMGPMPKLNGALWSLEVEVQWYILAPLVCTVYKLHSKPLRRIAIAALPLSMFMIYWHFIPGVSLPRYIGMFAVGMLLADIYVVDWQSKPTKNWAWDVLSVASIALLLAVTKGYDQHWKASLWRFSYLYPPLLLVLYIGSFRSHVLNAIIRNRWLVTIGGMCYSLYLYQEIILHSTWSHFAHSGMPHLLSALVRLALCLLAGGFMFVLIEKPCMRRDWHLALRAWVRRVVVPASVSTHQQAETLPHRADAQDVHVVEHTHR